MNSAEFRIKLITFLRNYADLFRYYAFNVKKRNEQKIKKLNGDGRFQELLCFRDWCLKYQNRWIVFDELYANYGMFAQSRITSKFHFFFNQLTFFKWLYMKYLRDDNNATRKEFCLKLLLTLTEAEENFFMKLKDKSTVLCKESKGRCQRLQKLCELEGVTAKKTVKRLKALQFVKLADLPVPDSLKS